MPTSHIIIGGRKLFLDFTGTITTGFTPRFADGELGEQCEDCGADLAETMELWDESCDDSRRWIRCAACSLQYKIHTST